MFTSYLPLCYVLSPCMITVGLEILRLDGDVLNKLLRPNGMGCISTLGLGVGLTTLTVKDLDC
jgi:hypothetical protein